MLEDIIYDVGVEVVVFAPGFVYKPKRERIMCLDGTSISAQANRDAYCTPRSDYGPYTEVEVGYPSVNPPEDWDEYHDGGGIYAYVPVRLVREFVAIHGGEMPVPIAWILWEKEQ